MRIHHHGVGDGLQRTVSTAASDGAPAAPPSSGGPDVSPLDDAVQLSYLSGVLNSLHLGAKHNAAKMDCVARLVQQNRYQVDAIALSRKLVAASLQ